MSIRNVYPEITSFRNLLRAEEHCAHGKRNNIERLNYFDKLDENILLTSEMLRNGQVPKVQYRSFYVYVPKVRKVIFIDYRSKVIQRAIYDILNPRICKTLINDTYACIPGRGQLNAMQKLYGWFRNTRTSGEKWYYYKFDVAKFFYRIDHEIMMQLLAKKIGDRRAVDLIGYYVCNDAVPFGMPVDADQLTIREEDMLYNVGIPIGGGLSHMLGNLYLDPLDQFVKRDLRCKRYIRYMDDIILASQKKEYLKECGKRMEEFAAEKLRLEFNAKTALRPVKCGCEFVGYRIFDDHAILRKTTTLRMKQHMEFVMDQYHDGLITFAQANATVQTYLAMMSHASCERFRTKFVENIVFTHGDRNFIDIRGYENDNDYSKAMVVGL